MGEVLAVGLGRVPLAYGGDAGLGVSIDLDVERGVEVGGEDALLTEGRVADLNDVAPASDSDVVEVADVPGMAAVPAEHGAALPPWHARKARCREAL